MLMHNPAQIGFQARMHVRELVRILTSIAAFSFFPAGRVDTNRLYSSSSLEIDARLVLPALA